MKLKVLAVMLGTGVLVGCAGQTSHANFHHQPLVKDVHLNMTEASVRSVAGAPASTYRRQSRVGTCYNYVLTSQGESTPYFVSFDAAGVVDNKGFKTCREFDRSQDGGPADGDSNRAVGF